MLSHPFLSVTWKNKVGCLFWLSSSVLALGGKMVEIWRLISGGQGWGHLLKGPLCFVLPECNIKCVGAASLNVLDKYQGPSQLSCCQSSFNASVKALHLSLCVHSVKMTVNHRCLSLQIVWCQTVQICKLSLFTELTLLLCCEVLGCDPLGESHYPILPDILNYSATCIVSRNPLIILNNSGCIRDDSGALFCAFIFFCPLVHWPGVFLSASVCILSET